MTREGGEPNLAEQKYFCIFSEVYTHTDDSSRAAVNNVTNTNTVATVVIDGVFIHIVAIMFWVGVRLSASETVGA